MTTQTAPRDWGKICVTTRLEKQVEAEFVASWTGLLMAGLRKGDAVRLTRGKVAHVAQNENVRAFLLETECDTFLSLDSDADFPSDFLERFRMYAPGWEFDLFQAFHLRRAWPPEAIWLTYNKAGDFIEQQLLLGRGEMELGLVGTHCALIRREVFVKIYETHGKPQGIPLEEFEWFTYPRHKQMSDEAQFSHEARQLGFRLGGTTEVRLDHITRRSIGWNEYQEHLTHTHAHARADYYLKLSQMVADFTGEPVDVVQAKALEGSKNVRDAWEKAKPHTAEEARRFYGDKDNGYLYDLLAWNWGEVYWKIIAGLDKYHGKTALVVGAGLGTEVERLKTDNTVLIYELEGILTKFLEERFSCPVGKITQNKTGGSIAIFEHQPFKELAWPGYKFSFDLIVAIDTLEHIHPDEIESTLRALDDLLAPGGVLYVHNNFGEQDKYPMHYDHTAIFEAWLKAGKYERISQYEYRKP